MPALLRGLIFAPGGHAMTPTHTRKDGKLYRYYVATDAIRLGHAGCTVRSVPAAEVEEALVAQCVICCRRLRSSRGHGRRRSMRLSCRSARSVTDFAPLWDELFPAEQARIVRLLVERVDVAQDHIDVRLRAEGLQTLVEQLRTTDAKAHAA